LLHNHTGVCQRVQACILLYSLTFLIDMTTISLIRLASFPAIVFVAMFLVSCSSTSPKLDVNTPVIRLERTMCFGSCPAYNLEFRGDCTAQYEGFANVEKIGVYRAKVDEASLRVMMDRFNKINFFELNDIYDDRVTDIPTYTVTYQLGTKKKTVIDRFNPPPGLRELERSLDSVAKQLDWKPIN
jgi:hypothetical protein